MINLYFKHPGTNAKDKTGSKPPPITSEEVQDHPRVKRFVPKDDHHVDEEASKKPKSRRSNKRTKKTSKTRLGSKGRSLDSNSNDKDLETRVMELESVVAKMRKTFTIDLNNLRSNIDILRNQVIEKLQTPSKANIPIIKIQLLK